MVPPAQEIRAIRLLCTIRQAADAARFEFLIRDLEHGATTLSAERLLLAADARRIDEARARLAQHLSRSPWHRNNPNPLLQDLGDALTACALPQSVVQLLSEVPRGSELIIESNERLMPWELCRVAQQYLWQRCAVARREILAARRLNPAWPQPPGTTAKRALIIADPDGTLQAARSEGAALQRLAVERGWAVDLLSGPAATTLAVLESLESKAYQWLHFACNAAWDAHNPMQSRLYLADEALPMGRLWEMRWAASPRLAFLGFCQAQASERAPDFIGRSTAWSRLFMEAGAGCVIGPLWDVSDVVSEQLVLSFYRDFLDGMGTGEALWRSRLALDADDAYGTAHAWVLYGDASVRPMTLAEAETEDWRNDVACHLLVGERTVPLLADTMREGRRVRLGPGRDLDVGVTGELCWENGAWSLYGDMRVNGRPGSPARLGNGDLIEGEGGSFVFMLGPPGGGTPRATHVLEVVEGVHEDQGLTFSVVADMRIGRTADADVRLHDPGVSRRHAEIAVSPEGCILSATAETFVNGVPLTGSRRLEPDDEIRVGPRTLLRFRTLAQ
jgi:hypothetical protein